MTLEAIQAALKTIKYPGFTRDIVSFGLVRSVDFQDGIVAIQLHITASDPAVSKKIQGDIEATVSALPGVQGVSLKVMTPEPKKILPSQLGSIRYAVAIASGKGGVGKSTVTVNLAYALQQCLAHSGKHVGILDCDIYGPSIPGMLGIEEQPQLDGELLIPSQKFGIQVMSMGILIDEGAPVVWRGPMVTKAIHQFTTNVRWGTLEVLLVDLPPGTGDAHLSLTQSVPLDGAIIVTTPQAAAVRVAQRGAAMFPKVNVPLIGVIENMSYLEAANGREYIFGQGGGRWAAQVLGTQFMGEIPLNQSIREGADTGVPVALSYPESTAAKGYTALAESLLAYLATLSKPDASA